MLDCGRDPETRMRRFPLLSITFLGLALSFGLVACTDDGGAEAAETNTENGDGDGDDDPTGDGDDDPTSEGDGDGETGCFDAPEQCLRFVECIGGIVPEQQAVVEAEYGAEGSCWCGTDAEAQACFKTCVDQLDLALENNPTVSACHENNCALEDLDPEQPYGPITNGSCSTWNGNPQQPFMNPLGLPGGFCAPECSGIAKSCPEHTQTAAKGTCYLVGGGTSYCVSLCWVDPVVIGGTQCQCGATCQPYGAPDGEGNMRGICTFE